MKVFPSVVGIDPSGGRLALVAVRTGLGGPFLAAPPVTVDLRGDRAASGPEGTESALSDYVARHGLAGCGARLCVPADKVFTARIRFPSLREKDLRPALSLELDRLFPLPASALQFVYRKVGRKKEGKTLRLVIAAVPSSFLESWERLVSRAGLVLTGAVPAGWALSAALAKAGYRPEGTAAVSAVLRDAGGMAECTVLAGEEPVYCTARACPAEAIPAEALSLAESGLPDASFFLSEGPVTILSPSGWYAQGVPGGEGGTVTYRREEGLEGKTRKLLGILREEGAGDDGSAWEVLGAYGAACDGSAADLLARGDGQEESPFANRTVRILGVLTILLALAWPATVAWRAKAELRRIETGLAEIGPSVNEVEEVLKSLDATGEKIAFLQAASSGRGEALNILRELTDRLPDGTWLTALRTENEKIEVNGLSSSASEIFPRLTQDGRFRDVEFASPITRQADNMERFQIRGVYRPGPAPRGAGNP